MVCSSWYSMHYLAYSTWHLVYSIYSAAQNANTILNHEENQYNLWSIHHINLLLYSHIIFNFKNPWISMAFAIVKWYFKGFRSLLKGSSRNSMFLEISLTKTSSKKSLWAMQHNAAHNARALSIMPEYCRVIWEYSLGSRYWIGLNRCNQWIPR